MNEPKDTTTMKLDPLAERLKTEKESAYNFQSRRHAQWDTNYELYRDRVQTNRLTQRQAVNYPLMKETLLTVLSNIDDPPDVMLKILELGEAAEKKEMILNELWDYYYDKGNYEDLDVLDKKNVLLTGRSFKKLNFLNREFELDVLDTFDVLVDPKVKPLDLESARYIIHTHIFKPLREIMAEDKYLAKGKGELKTHLNSKEGIVQSEENKERLEDKQERMEAVGVDNFDEFAGSDVIVELDEHYTYLWDKEKEEFIRYVVVVANETVILFKKPLMDVLGVEKYPITTWADDIDVSDFWSDGKADSIRGLNKILNIWLSQLLENRTYRNFGMHFFDSTDPDFVPQEFTPKPFGMYPIPGNPNEILKQVDIKDMSESLDEMAFLISAAEKVTSAVPVTKGVGEKGPQTKGEVELLFAASQESFAGTSKHYNKAWKQTVEKWFEIIDANVSYADVVSLYKESISGKMYELKASPKDWKSEAGYKTKVTSKSSQRKQDITELQKIMFIQARFPNNPKIQKWAEKKMLELTGASIDEIKDLTEGEKQLPEGMEIPKVEVPKAAMPEEAMPIPV